MTSSICSVPYGLGCCHNKGSVGLLLARRRSAEPGFWRFFAELNAGLILTAFAIVAFKTPNHFAFGGTSGVPVILSTLVPTLPVGVFMWILNIILVVLGFIFLERAAPRLWAKIFAERTNAGALIEQSNSALRVENTPSKSICPHVG